jgi:hypothetical protein
MFTVTVDCATCGGCGVVPPAGCSCSGGSHNATAGCLPVSCSSCGGSGVFNVTTGGGS